jgi:hypothetical protein
MEGLSADGKDGNFIQSAMEMVVRFSVEVTPQVAEWQRRLLKDPDTLEVIEHEVRQQYLRGSGLLIAGLLAAVMQSPEVIAASTRTRVEYSTPLAKPRERKIAIRLLGGVLMWATTLYCEPKRGRFRKPDDQATGLYIKLAQFGFGKKESPALESRIARQCALCPSFELARDELKREGLSLSIKAVRRVAQQCGDDLLKLRTLQLQEWRAGTLASTDEVASLSVTVQIDGGRTKIRGDLRKATPEPEKRDESDNVVSDAPGRSKAQAKQSFDAEWRELKLATIFVHNEKGRMVKKSKATIDGTFTGPDAMAEIVAMHLHRLGAAKAKSITFVSDGAVWIWDRIATIVKQAKLPDTVKIYQVLDNCHAVHHVSLALKSLNLSDNDRMASYRDLRSRLRNGAWRSVVKELQQHADRDDENEKLVTEISYLQRHGEAVRLAYPFFKGLGLPLGSGAIESSIRRVINMRLKGNGIYWLKDNAESMLQLRSLVISHRWDERIQFMRIGKTSRCLTSWKWSPSPMNTVSELKFKTSKNTA